MDFSAASFAVTMSDVRAVADSALIMFLISLASLLSGVVSGVAPLVTAVPSIPVNRSLRFPRLSLACCELVIMEDEVVRHREALATPVGSGTGSMSAHHTCAAGGSTRQLALALTPD